VAGLTDEESRQLPVVVDETFLDVDGTTTWTTDAGWIEVLVGLETHSRGRIGYDELAQRSHLIVGEGYIIQPASLLDIIEAKEVANRPKDLDALPELR